MHSLLIELVLDACDTVVHSLSTSHLAVLAIVFCLPGRATHEATSMQVWCAWCAW